MQQRVAERIAAAAVKSYDLPVNEPILYQVVRDQEPCEWLGEMTEEETKAMLETGAIKYCLALQQQLKNALDKKGYQLLSLNSHDGQNVYACISKNAIT